MCGRLGRMKTGKCLIDIEVRKNIALSIPCLETREPEQGEVQIRKEEDNLPCHRS